MTSLIRGISEEKIPMNLFTKQKLTHRLSCQRGRENIESSILFPSPAKSMTITKLRTRECGSISSFLTGGGQAGFHEWGIIASPNGRAVYAYLRKLQVIALVFGFV